MHANYITKGRVALITIDHPPVNALSAQVRMGLAMALAQAEADPSVGVVVIRGGGSGFSAGADVRELAVPLGGISLGQLCQRIEDCRKPVLAALHGNTLGGGLALALAAHYRLALNDAKLGLPEVHLGLVPSAGGTQRTPRLIGVGPALQLMLEGAPMNAGSALACGLVDWVADDSDIEEVALVYGLDLLREGVSPKRTRDRFPDSWEATLSYHAELASLHALRLHLQPDKAAHVASRKIIDAVEAALTLPFETGLALERLAYLECLDSPQHQCLLHAFLTKRKANTTTYSKP